MGRKPRTTPKTLEKKEKRVDMYEKQDVDIEACQSIQQKQDKGKVPLRIDSRTIVMVYPHQRTKEYAEKLRQKYQQNRDKYHGYI